MLYEVANVNMTDEMYEELTEEEPQEELSEELSEEQLEAARRREKRRMRRIGRIIDRIFGFFLATLLMLSIIWLALEYVIVKGPSPTWKETFVLSMLEDPRTAFLANVYLTQAEVEEIAAGAVAGTEERDSWIPAFLERAEADS